MPTITDHDQTIQGLRARLEESEHERERLTIAIAEHVEALGGEGKDADALRDALGQIERLLDGKDLYDEFEGVAGRVAALERRARLQRDREKAATVRVRLAGEDGP